MIGTLFALYLLTLHTDDIAMAKDEETPEGEEAEPKKGGGLIKTLMMGIGFAVVVAGSNVATTMFVAMPFIEQTIAAYSPATMTGEGGDMGGADMGEPPIYHPLAPPMIVNFSDGSSGFLQVSLEVMARSQEVIEAVKAHDPAIRNNLLLLFAAQDYDMVATREGKEELRLEVLEEIQTVLDPYLDATSVEEVYFTAFVAQ